MHLAVVDPEVGGERRAVAVRTAEDDRILVGPDNGLLALAIERFGGAVEAVDVARSPHRLEPDVGHLPRARPVRAGGRRTWRPARRWPTRATRSTPTTSRRCTRRAPAATNGGLVAHALAFDRFGNVMLDVEHAELAGSGLKLGHRVTINDELAHYATTFADVPPGELLLYEDAYRTLALAVNRGSAALHLGLDLDAEVHIRPAAG